MQFVNKLLKATICDNTTIIPTEYRENGWSNNILLNSEGLTAPLCYFNGHIYSISNFKLRWYNKDTAP